MGNWHLTLTLTLTLVVNQIHEGRALPGEGFDWAQVESATFRELT